nr:endonuclease [Alphaproteobacteria bacterium]
VTKMKFANKADKSTIIYNECITISNIPLEAYDYVVNGKSAIEWVIDRYTTNPALAYKASGNKNNPNDYAPDNPDYILNLLQSVITLSMESIKIINQLPKSVEE